MVAMTKAWCWSDSIGTFLALFPVVAMTQAWCWSDSIGTFLALFPVVAVTQVWCWSDSMGTFLALSRQLVERVLFQRFVLRAIDVVMSVAFCPQVVCQTPQLFRSSETQATCEGCVACQSVCSPFSSAPECTRQ